MVTAEAALAAAPALSVSALSMPGLDALWAAYVRAELLAERAWRKYGEMRQAGGSSGEAGLLYSAAYRVQAASDDAYRAWLTARGRAGG